MGFVLQSYRAFANISSTLGKEHVASLYKHRANGIVRLINRFFFHPETGAYAAGTKSFGGASQAGNGMALFLQIAPEKSREKVLDVMVANAKNASYVNGSGQGPAVGGPGPHMTAGLFGIKWFLMSLSDGDKNDLAFEVLTTPSYPSYQWMMNNPYANATTLWEAWFFSDNIYSHNHPMFASSEVRTTYRINL